MFIFWFSDRSSAPSFQQLSSAHEMPKLVPKRHHGRQVSFKYEHDSLRVMYLFRIGRKDKPSHTAINHAGRHSQSVLLGKRITAIKLSVEKAIFFRCWCCFWAPCCIKSMRFDDHYCPIRHVKTTVYGMRKSISLSNLKADDASKVQRVPENIHRLWFLVSLHCKSSFHYISLHFLTFF